MKNVLTVLSVLFAIFTLAVVAYVVNMDIKGGSMERLPENLWLTLMGGGLLVLIPQLLRDDENRFLDVATKLYIGGITVVTFTYLASESLIKGVGTDTVIYGFIFFLGFLAAWDGIKSLKLE